MKTYNPRQEFSVEDRTYIISNIKTSTLKSITEHLNEINPNRTLPVTENQVDSVVRQFRRIANTKIKQFKEDNELDKAEKLQSIIDSVLPTARNVIDNVMLDILYSLEK